MYCNAKQNQHVKICPTEKITVFKGMFILTYNSKINWQCIAVSAKF